MAGPGLGSIRIFVLEKSMPRLFLAIDFAPGILMLSGKGDRLILVLVSLVILFLVAVKTARLCRCPLLV